MCLQRGWEGSQRAHSCQGGGREPVEASCHTKTPWEGGGVLFLTNPAQLLRGCEGGRVGYLCAAKCLAQVRNMGRVGCSLCLQPHLQPFRVSLPATGCWSCPNQSSCRGMPGWRDCSPSRSEWNYVEQEADFRNTVQEGPVW